MATMVARKRPAPEVEPAMSRVAALMPAYNPGPEINEAIESLVNSTYPCDIYIVDDGSKVSVADVLPNFPRTKVIRLEKNCGVARALNAGLKEILRQPYDFVARLDADDISHPDRIAKQVAFLDRHPDIAAVGAWARFTDENSGRTLFIERTPDQPEAVKKALYQNTVVVHSSVMLRADVLKQVGPYSLNYPVAEDYELFRRISQQYALANIPSVLVDRRLSWGGVSLTRRRRQLFDRLMIQLRYFRAAEPRAWAGLAKTLLLFCIPVSVIAKIKEYRGRS
jgi:GT2 family glycosyltransferase